jgi:hypothetical protein
MNPMAVAQGAIKTIGGVANIITSSIGGRARREEQRTAQREFELAKAAYANQDITNPYANLQNTAEDLTVNQQQAQFQAQQQQQVLANTMGGMQGAAGGSGIAALAQAMANQQQQGMQKASASIGLQESANQRIAAQQGARIQMQKAHGIIEHEERKASHMGEMLQMSSERKSAADEAREQAKEGLMSGITDFVGGGIEAAAGLAGSDRKLKKNIKLIGYSPSGLRIYAFEYINKAFGYGFWQGVMSDEIPQKAVIKHKDGYDRVDYSKLDVEFKQI